MFDVLHRYSIVVEQLFQERHKEISVLDVGTSWEGLHSFIQSKRVSIVNLDIVEPNIREYKLCPDVGFLQYDGINIPFEDNSFDFVISTDTLEHVEPKLRKFFLNELIRVAKNKVILVYPHEDGRVHERIIDFLTFKRSNFLREHEKYGIPKVQFVKRILHYNDKVKSVESKRSMNIYLWGLMKLVGFPFSRIFWASRGFRYPSFKFYKMFLYPILRRGKGYSNIFIITKE